MTEATSEDITGGCACGAIRYRCSAPPIYMGNCHCRDCQQATGGAYLPAVLFRGEHFTLEQGEPKVYDRPCDKGHVMSRAFCGDCGSPVYLINGARPDGRVVYAGSLDDSSWYKPKWDIYAKSAQPWDMMDPDLPKHQAMPK